jgi:NitT/TauT family transport system substrate-binding protein
MKIRTGTKMLPVAAAAATLLALSGCGAAPSGQAVASSPAGGADGAPTALTVGTGGQLSNADVDLGMSEGLFEQSGLEVSVKTLTAGSSAVPQLLEGSLQFAAVDLATAITATQQNVGITAVAPPMQACLPDRNRGSRRPPTWSARRSRSTSSAEPPRS